jgi:hypothetical protein
MPVAEERTNALATAAAAAAAGAAIYGLRKALSNGGGRGAGPGDNGDNGDDGDAGETGEGGGHSLLATLWESASDTILPMADQAARTAGGWVAANSPEVVRSRIVPQFVDGFEDAA